MSFALDFASHPLLSFSFFLGALVPLRGGVGATVNEHPCKQPIYSGSLDVSTGHVADKRTVDGGRTVFIRHLSLVPRCLAPLGCQGCDVMR